MMNYFSKLPLFEGKVLEQYQQGFYIFETLYSEKGKIRHASFHFERLKESLDKLNWPSMLNGKELKVWWPDFINHIETQKDLRPQRIKLSLIPDFENKILVADLIMALYQKPEEELYLCFDPEAFRHSQDKLWQYKWGERVRMNYFLKKISSKADDVIFLNENNEVCETTRHNIVVKTDNKLVTPPLSSGLLPGTYRNFLLKEKQIEERLILKDELLNAKELWVCNALTGLHPARLIKT